MSGQYDSDVIIVGGGPVGLGLAIDLAQRGISSSVIERYPTIQPIPKGQNMTQRTGEHFRAWNCSAEIRKASPIPHDFGSIGVMAFDTLLSDYNYQWLRRSDVRQYYAADNERLPQYETEAVLRARAAELSEITCHYGWTARALEQDEEGATVTAQQKDGTGELTLRGRYVVGCDGSGSTTRELVGIEQDVDPHDKRMVLLVFRSNELHEQLISKYPGISYFNALKPGIDGYWLFLGRVNLEGAWFFHAPVPLGTNKDNFDFAGYLHDAVGSQFDIDFDYFGFWEPTAS